MSAAMTPTDAVNVLKFLERLRTEGFDSELAGKKVEGDGAEMLQRVEAHLGEWVRTYDKPLGNGGPAFPTENARQTGPSSWHEEGMTLRDYFAAKAMAQLIAIYEPSGEEGTVPDCAQDAYHYADAMLAARQGGAEQAGSPAPTVAADPFVKLTSHSGEIIDLREVETIVPSGTFPDECTLVMRSGARWSVSGEYQMTAQQSATHWRDLVSAAKKGGAA